MKPKFLFPHRYKTIGWLLAIPCLVLGLFCLYADFQFSFLEVNLPFRYLFNDTVNKFTTLNFTDELATVGLIIGLIFIAFSKEKIEDEYVSEIRLESLQWAIYVNFGVLILATIFVHGGSYFSVMIYNMFTPLLIFIIRFNYILYFKPQLEKKEAAL
jgi:hypothetical protein